MEYVLCSVVANSYDILTVEAAGLLIFTGYTSEQSTGSGPVKMLHLKLRIVDSALASYSEYLTPANFFFGNNLIGFGSQQQMNQVRSWSYFLSKFHNDAP